MKISNLSKQEIKQYIQQTKQHNHGSPVRMIFVPNEITEQNFKEICATYNTALEQEFDSVVVIESHKNNLDKKLSMPSNKWFESRFGKVPADDFLRNEFCDEEDDFFIADEGYSKDMSLYAQLPMLQACFTDFNILSLQIGGYDPAIIKELAFTLDELLRHKNALLVFCCDVPAGSPAELETLRELVVNNNESGLLNYLNSSKKTVEGARAFMSGILVARAWGYNVEFLDHIDTATHICGYAVRPVPQPA